MQAPWCSVHLNLFNCAHQINNRASTKYLLGEMWKILSYDELLDLKLINAEECFPISKSVIRVSNLAHRPLSLLWENTSELHTDTSTVKLVNLEHQSVHNDVLWTKFMHDHTLFFNWTYFKFLRIQLVWNTCVQLYLISYQLMRLFQTATCGKQMSMPYVPHGTERVKVKVPLNLFLSSKVYSCISMRKLNKSTYSVGTKPTSYYANILK